MDYSSFIQEFSIWALPVLFAITAHEVAHGWVASWFGDQTARLSGRLTLSPLKHIDPIGTVLVPILLLLSHSGFLFGWAKPVPVDSRNLRRPRLDMAFVAAAGPIANMIMALLWGGIAKIGMVFLNHDIWGGEAINLMGVAGIQINIVLAVLNCLPFPPLDGGRVLLTLLPGRIAYKLLFLENYSFFIIVLLMLTGVLQYLIVPPSTFFIQGIMNLFALS
jgi:Zn-dependent protease